MRKYTVLRIKEKIGYFLSLLSIVAGIILCIKIFSDNYPECIPLRELFSYLPDDGIILSIAVIVTSIVLAGGPFFLAWLFYKIGNHYEKKALKHKR